MPINEQIVRINTEVKSQKDLLAELEAAVDTLPEAGDKEFWVLTYADGTTEKIEVLVNAA
jgi:hypothetical protein